MKSILCPYSCEPPPTEDLLCRFVYQVVVPKTLASNELVKVYESDDKVVLPPWDPMVNRPSCLFYHSHLCMYQGSLA